MPLDFILKIKSHVRKRFLITSEEIIIIMIGIIYVYKDLKLNVIIALLNPKYIPIK